MIHRFAYIAYLILSLSYHGISQRSTILVHLLDTADMKDVVIGAQILVTKNDSTKQRLFSDLDGSFQLMLPAGNYVIKVTMPNYIPVHILNVQVDGYSKYWIQKPVILTPVQIGAGLGCDWMHKPPLLHKDVTSGGQVLADYQIHRLSNYHGYFTTTRRKPSVVYYQFKDLIKSAVKLSN